MFRIPHHKQNLWPHQLHQCILPTLDLLVNTEDQPLLLCHCTMNRQWSLRKLEKRYYFILCLNVLYFFNLWFYIHVIIKQRFSVFILNDQYFWTEVFNAAVKNIFFLKVSDIIKLDSTMTLPDRTNSAFEWHVFYPHFV